MARIKKIYAEAWSENWGAVPPTEEEFDRIVGELRLIYDRDMFFIAEYDGEPAGMSLVLPDMNQALKKAGGRLFPLGLLRMLWHRRKINAWRMPLLGVRQEHRLRGIEVVLLSYVRCRQEKQELTGRASCLDTREQSPAMPAEETGRAEVSDVQNL